MLGIFIKNFLIIVFIILTWATIWEIFENLVINPIEEKISPIYSSLVFFAMAIVFVIIVFSLSEHHYFQQHII